MKKLTLLAASAVSLLLLTGCAAKSGNETLGQMEKGQIEKKIIKGKTTKAEIVAMFGSPQYTDLDTNGNEKWSYNYYRADGKLVNYIPVLNSLTAGTNNSSKSLTILFNGKGVVKNYTSTNSKTETNTGLF